VGKSSKVLRFRSGFSFPFSAADYPQPVKKGEKE
jgi:hypothetical protein